VADRDQASGGVDRGAAIPAEPEELVAGREIDRLGERVGRLSAERAHADHRRHGSTD
jgi:hypothetical protein